MDRRNFCKSVGGAAIGMVAAPIVAEEQPKLRAIYQLIDGQRKQVRMYELQAGNIIIFGDDPVHQWWITSDPYLHSDGLWTVEAKLRNILYEGIAN